MWNYLALEEWDLGVNVLNVFKFLALIIQTLAGRQRKFSVNSRIFLSNSFELSCSDRYLPFIYSFFVGLHTVTHIRMNLTAMEKDGGFPPEIAGIQTVPIACPARKRASSRSVSRHSIFFLFRFLTFYFPSPTHTYMHILVLKVYNKIFSLI